MKPPFKPIYHLSEKKLIALKEELTKLLKLGHIFFVEEPDKLRPVIDYRALNKITIRNRTALPNMRELMDRLKHAKFLSKLDLQSGFHQKSEEPHTGALGYLQLLSLL